MVKKSDEFTSLLERMSKVHFFSPDKNWICCFPSCLPNTSIQMQISEAASCKSAVNMYQEVKQWTSRLPASYEGCGNLLFARRIFKAFIAGSKEYQKCNFIQIQAFYDLNQSKVQSLRGLIGFLANCLIKLMCYRADVLFNCLVYIFPVFMHRLALVKVNIKLFKDCQFSKTVKTLKHTSSKY